MALVRLEEFESRMGKTLSGDRSGLADVVPFFAFAPSIRKMIYTTDEIEP